LAHPGRLVDFEISILGDYRRNHLWKNFKKREREREREKKREPAGRVSIVNLMTVGPNHIVCWRVSSFWGVETGGLGLGFFFVTGT